MDEEHVTPPVGEVPVHAPGPGEQSEGLEQYEAHPTPNGEAQSYPHTFVSPPPSPVPKATHRPPSVQF
jgi:hypothetical protein